MTRRRLCSPLLVVALLAGSSGARAAGPEACDRLAKEQASGPRPATLLSLARCQERSGQLAAAVRSYRALASTSLAPTAKAALRTLGPRVPELVITVAAPSPELRVERDGVPVEKAEWNGPQPVDPGSHVVTATAFGKKPWTGTVSASSGVVTLAVPPLEDDPVTAGLQGTALRPLASLEGATWSAGVGFVVPGGSAPPSLDAPAGPTVPDLHDDNLNRVGVSLDVGAVTFSGGPVGSGHAAVRTDFTVRPEYRRTTSYVAPWFDLKIIGGYAPDAKIGFAGGGGHLGIDVHPFRVPYFGIGPSFGYTGLVFLGQGAIVVDHGPDVGLLNVRYRLQESESSPPLLDVVTYLVERFSIPNDAAATFSGLRLSIGGSVRFRAFFEARVFGDGGDSLRLLQQLHGGIGVGSAE